MFVTVGAQRRGVCKRSQQVNRHRSLQLMKANDSFHQINKLQL